jgi:hypothetical protein
MLIGLRRLFMTVYAYWRCWVLHLIFLNQKHIAHAWSASVWIVGSQCTFHLIFRSFFFLDSQAANIYSLNMILTVPFCSFWRDGHVKFLPVLPGLFILIHTVVHAVIGYFWKVDVILFNLLLRKIYIHVFFVSLRLIWPSNPLAPVLVRFRICLTYFKDLYILQRTICLYSFWNSSLAWYCILD